MDQESVVSDKSGLGIRAAQPAVAGDPGCLPSAAPDNADWVVRGFVHLRLTNCFCTNISTLRNDVEVSRRVEPEWGPKHRASPAVHLERESMHRVTFHIIENSRHAAHPIVYFLSELAPITRGAPSASATPGTCPATPTQAAPRCPARTRAAHRQTRGARRCPRPPARPARAGTH